jgi:hypothetical protein
MPVQDVKRRPRVAAISRWYSLVQRDNSNVAMHKAMPI